MSVQTEIDRINGEVTSQTELLAQIQTALEGKAAGGGGSIETCSVTFTPTDGVLEGIGCSYLSFSDGEQLHCNGSGLPDSTVYEITILKNSILCINCEGIVDCTFTVSGDATILAESIRSITIGVLGDCEIGFARGDLAEGEIPF